MNLIAWILFGIVVGLVGYGIDSSQGKRGLMSYVLLGMGGALLGGIVASTLYGFTLEKFNLLSFMLAISGSLFLLIGGRTLQRG